MNCLYCHEPVPDLGDTFPRTVHLECVVAWHDELEAAEHALFVASIPKAPAGVALTWPKWASLTTATQRTNDS